MRWYGYTATEETYEPERNIPSFLLPGIGALNANSARQPGNVPKRSELQTWTVSYTELEEYIFNVRHGVLFC